MNAIQTLQTAVRVKDAKLAGRAVDTLRAAGHNYKDCYRIALGGNPDLTLNEWEDLMAEADGA